MKISCLICWNFLCQMTASVLWTLRFDEIISLFPYSRWPTPLFWIKPTKVALKNWLKEKTAQGPSIIYVEFYDFIAGKCSFRLNFINLKWSSNTTIVQNLYYKTFYYKNDQNSDSLTVIDSFYEYTFKFVDFLFYKTNQFWAKKCKFLGWS